MDRCLNSYRAALADLASVGIRSRTIAGVNGLTVHLLEAGRQNEGRPRCCCCTGSRSWAYSWRKVMPALADAGYLLGHAGSARLRRHHWLVQHAAPRTSSRRWQ